MYTEVIDSLYENDAVEGVALFNDCGDLVENQLALGEDAVRKIGISLNRIRAGLLNSAREMKGFLLKTDKYLLQAIIHQDVLILLQVDPSSSSNQNYLMVKSQFGDRPVIPTRKPAPVEKPLFQPEQAVVDTGSAQKRQPKVVMSVPKPAEEKAARVVDWDEFRGSLVALIKRVTSGRVANKMISNASVEAGIILDQKTVELAIAVNIGITVVTKIPDASDRKLIENEYQLMVQRYLAV